jgi:hypothetical protein
MDGPEMAKGKTSTDATQPDQAHSTSIARIISGGQTGVDRGALDAAIALGIPHGGWCPLGRRSEDGPIPGRYQLWEMDVYDYAARTAQNILEGDATLILYEGSLRGGTLLTLRLVKRHNKPHRLIRLDQPIAIIAWRHWLETYQPSILNVAGPRESTRPGIARRAREWLVKHLASSNDLNRPQRRAEPQ